MNLLKRLIAEKEETKDRFLPMQQKYRLLEKFEAGAYTRPLFSSTYAVLVTPPRFPLSNRLGKHHAPNVSNMMCLR